MDFFPLFGADIWPRLAGILAGVIVAWAAQKGLTLDAKEVTAIILAVYSLVHQAIAARRTVRRLRSARWDK